MHTLQYTDQDMPSLQIATQVPRLCIKAQLHLQLDPKQHDITAAGLSGTSCAMH
jgi:hypothetical protein